MSARPAGPAAPITPAVLTPASPEVHIAGLAVLERVTARGTLRAAGAPHRRVTRRPERAGLPRRLERREW